MRRNSPQRKKIDKGRFIFKLVGRGRGGGYTWNCVGGAHIRGAQLKTVFSGCPTRKCTQFRSLRSFALLLKRGLYKVHQPAQVIHMHPVISFL